MLLRGKSHIKHHFKDQDDKKATLCKFVCTTFWATQFQAVRSAFLVGVGQEKEKEKEKVMEKEQNEDEFAHLNDDENFIRSLASSFFWAANGGKSGATFAKTSDGRFVVKTISRTELQMFIECAPAYFEYMSKSFFHGLPTVLCKVVGVYQVGYHNRVTGKKDMVQVAVMQNIFYGRKISKIFDLKGSTRGRYVGREGGEEGGEEREEGGVGGGGGGEGGGEVLLDENFLEFTKGRPLPLMDRSKAIFHMSILNDTLFLSIINIIDYSILVGIDEEKMELVVGIIDYLRQYDILKQLERVGKSVGMVAGQDSPTIIQPPLYKQRFQNAMEKYFATVPGKWTSTV
ncbi:hypothetical protein ScalyP_jg1490 [Parmales sp. scaly parma]|nr:hypothetical protein ScalyP_jg1490 [Parmales sp. scaly parma]